MYFYVGICTLYDWDINVCNRIYTCTFISFYYKIQHFFTLHLTIDIPNKTDNDEIRFSHIYSLRVHIREGNVFSSKYTFVYNQIGYVSYYTYINDMSNTQNTHTIKYENPINEG